MIELQLLYYGLALLMSRQPWRRSWFHVTSLVTSATIWTHLVATSGYNWSQSAITGFILVALVSWFTDARWKRVDEFALITFHCGLAVTAQHPAPLFLLLIALLVRPLLQADGLLVSAVLGYISLFHSDIAPITAIVVSGVIIARIMVSHAGKLPPLFPLAPYLIAPTLGALLTKEFLSWI